MLKKDLQKYAAPVLDEDFTNIVVSAVRYALPRHSYMPSLTRDYLKRYWPLLAKKHWCILRDIRDHYHDTLHLWDNHPDWTMEKYDLNCWVEFYNYLIEREDTNWPKYERNQHTPLEYVGEQN
jgi:hypothetical protein